MPLQQAPKIKLSDGHEMPILGLGTWKSAPGDVYKAVSHAIDVGYRHFDCALAYQNEHEVGKAIREKVHAGVIRREDIFVTSKCWNTFHSKERVIESFNKTMGDLDIGYLDLWLMHWPMGYEEGGPIFPLNEDKTTRISDVDFVETWKAMEEVSKSTGKIRSLGLSNFNSEQVERILKEATIKPVMNQVECHPYLIQKKLKAFCEERGIKITAYCPLGSPDRAWATADEPPLLEHPKIKEIGAKYGKTSAAVLLCFQIDRGVVVIPKSVTPARIEANLNVFDFKLTDEDIKTLEEFDRGYRFCSLANIKHHKYYPFSIEF
ncbi:aldo-keto reductase family 1 member B1 [Galendromus occidentalis]|uniref:Aldo-keto reductase family 1 member B1 n=1 Tax=Galendromus occidentalis TaxID=34638 RepID=A0AAJ6QTG6_9ACAR|nr:aldo-keto reductase family 1 member B1 [Galendromus occidentalis]